MVFSLSRSPIDFVCFHQPLAAELFPIAVAGINSPWLIVLLGTLELKVLPRHTITLTVPPR